MFYVEDYLCLETFLVAIAIIIIITKSSVSFKKQLYLELFTSLYL